MAKKDRLVTLTASSLMTWLDDVFFFKIMICIHTESVAKLQIMRKYFVALFSLFSFKRERER